MTINEALSSHRTRKTDRHRRREHKIFRNKNWWNTTRLLSQTHRRPEERKTVQPNTINAEWLPANGRSKTFRAFFFLLFVTIFVCRSFVSFLLFLSAATGPLVVGRTSRCYFNRWWCRCCERRLHWAATTSEVSSAKYAHKIHNGPTNKRSQWIHTLGLINTGSQYFFILRKRKKIFTSTEHTQWIGSHWGGSRGNTRKKNRLAFFATSFFGRRCCQLCDSQKLM